MKSITTPADLRPLVLEELLLINSLAVNGGTFWVTRVGSSGAAERRYLQALGLVQRASNGDQWALTDEGANLVLDAMRENA